MRYDLICLDERYLYNLVTLLKTEHGSPRIVAGFGRSGTTWVQDSLASANSLRTVFEPLNTKTVPEAGPYANKFLLEDDDEPELFRLLKRYFWEDFC